MTEETFRTRIEAAQNAFRGATQQTIAAVQREFAEATEAFRRWAHTHPCTVPAETFHARSEVVIYHYEWISPRQIRIID